MIEGLRLPLKVTTQMYNYKLQNFTSDVYFLSIRVILENAFRSSVVEFKT